MEKKIKTEEWQDGRVMLLATHRVPVRVIENDRVCARQVDAHATRSRGEDKEEEARVRVEALGQALPLFDLGAAIETQVPEGGKEERGEEEVHHRHAQQWRAQKERKKQQNNNNETYER